MESGTQNSIANMVQSKLTASHDTSKKDELVRFIVTLSPKHREYIRTLSDALHMPQIALATYILEQGLNTAMQALQDARKPKQPVNK